MPTFKFIRGGKELDEVVGADIGAVESKLKALRGSAGPGTSTKGYVLGSGKTVHAPGTPTPESTQQLYVMLALLGFMIFYYFNSVSQ